MSPAGSSRPNMAEAWETFVSLKRETWATVVVLGSLRRSLEAYGASCPYVPVSDTVHIEDMHDLEEAISEWEGNLAAAQAAVATAQSRLESERNRPRGFGFL